MYSKKLIGLTLICLLICLCSFLPSYWRSVRARSVRFNTQIVPRRAERSLVIGERLPFSELDPVDLELIDGLPSKVAQSLLQKRSELCQGWSDQKERSGAALQDLLEKLKGVGPVRAKKLSLLLDLETCSQPLSSAEYPETPARDPAHQ